MADSYVELNPGAGGAVMDEEQVTGYPSGPTTRLRSRIVIGGELPAELAKIRNTAPAAGDYGMVVRPLDEVAGSTDVTTVAATTTPFTVGDHSDTRLAITIYVEPGDDASSLYLKFGADPSTSSYSNRLDPGDYWESTPPRYTGLTTAVFDGTVGRIMITEFLPA